MITALQTKKDIFMAKVNSFFTYEEKMKIIQGITMLIASIFYMYMFSMAEVDINGLFGNLIGYVCDIFMYIGIILLVWAIGQLVLAFKNEDADSKSRAVMVIVCSVLLMGIGQIIDTVLTNSGITGIKRGEGLGNNL